MFSTLKELNMPWEKYLMIMNAFGNTQCLLCFKTFKEIRGYVLKRLHDSFHSTENRFSDRAKEELFFWKN